MGRSATTSAGNGRGPELSDKGSLFARSEDSERAKTERANLRKYRRGVKKYEREGRKEPKEKPPTPLLEKAEKPVERNRVRLVATQDKYQPTLWYIELKGRVTIKTTIVSKQQPDRKHPKIRSLSKYI